MYLRLSDSPSEDSPREGGGGGGGIILAVRSRFLQQREASVDNEQGFCDVLQGPEAEPGNGNERLHLKRCEDTFSVPQSYGGEGSIISGHTSTESRDY